MARDAQTQRMHCQVTEADLNWKLASFSVVLTVEMCRFFPGCSETMSAEWVVGRWSAGVLHGAGPPREHRHANTD